MLSTMQDFPLTITMLLRHGGRVHADSEIVTWSPDHVRRASFATVAEHAAQLAGALQRLGVERGDRVGTFCWNHQEHLELYLGVPCFGAVLHTLNIRLFPEQLVYVVNHAADRVIVVDDVLVPLLARVASQFTTVERYLVIGDGDVSALEAAAPGREILRYHEMLAAEPTEFAWPDLDERDAAAMCYTSGTTGNPKGVVYSHRSTVLHTMSVMGALPGGFSDHDRALLIVPMFHANGWGMPYVAWNAGADLIMPGPHLQSEPLVALIRTERPTCSAAVPTIWGDVLRFAHAHPDDVDFSSLRRVLCGGAAVPAALMAAFDELGVRIIQGWGMTETSPLASVATVPRGVDLDGPDAMVWRSRTGRVLPGVEMRIVADDGTVLPWDGEAVGEIEVRGPWVIGSYYADPSLEKFDDGWLRTGDVGRIDSHGYVQITDRAKDVIKSGGEWISTVELENLLMAHPAIAEAAVIGIPDPRWDERPLACVVRKDGATCTAAELREFLRGDVADWQLPEYFAFLDVIPKTSVGKFDKKVLRSEHAAGSLTVESLR